MSLSWEVVVIITLGSTLGSLWLSRFVLLRLPADYFVCEDATRAPRGKLAFVARNVAGLLLVILGLVMAVPGVPGQGLLTMMVGLVLLDIPGKRNLERRLLGNPRALAAINSVREHAQVAPLLPPITPPPPA